MDDLSGNFSSLALRIFNGAVAVLGLFFGALLASFAPPLVVEAWVTRDPILMVHPAWIVAVAAGLLYFSIPLLLPRLSPEVVRIGLSLLIRLIGVTLGLLAAIAILVSPFVFYQAVTTIATENQPSYGWLEISTLLSISVLMLVPCVCLIQVAWSMMQNRLSPKNVNHFCGWMAFFIFTFCWDRWERYAEDESTHQTMGDSLSSPLFFLAAIWVAYAVYRWASHCLRKFLFDTPHAPMPEASQ